MKAIFVAVAAADAAIARRRADRVCAFYPTYLPDIFDPEPRRWRSGKGVEVAFWVKRAAIEGPARTRGARRLFLATGYTTKPLPETPPRDARAAYAGAGSWGGMGAYLEVRGRANRMHAWSTRPQVDPLYYSGGNPDFCVVANRPLAASFACAAAPGPSIRRDFLFEAAAAGFSLSFTTPYDGVYRCPPRRALAVSDRRVRIVEHPLPLPEEEDMPLEDAVDIYIGALRTAIEPVRARDCAFRLSGGKDSRLVAVLAQDAGLAPPAVTRMNGCPNEALVAGRVAALCGLPHEVEGPVVRSRTPLEGLRRLNRLTEGLGLNGAAYQEEIAQSHAARLVTGQGELHRGGWSASSRDTDPALPRLLSRLTMRRFMSPEVRRLNRDRLRRWAVSAPGRPTTKRLLYWAFHDWSLSHWYGKRLMHWDANVLEQVVPCIDDAVTAALARIPLAHKDDESLLLGSVQRLNPAAAEIPLHGPDWRLRGGGHTPGVPPEPLAIRPPPRPPGRRHSPEPRADDAFAAGYILSSRVRGDMAQALSKRMFRALDAVALGRPREEVWPRRSATTAVNLLWRTAGLAALYDEGL